MATLSLGISGSGLGNTNGTRNGTISDADIVRLIAWGRAAYPVSPDTRTNAQVLNAIAGGFFQALKDAVKNAERSPPVEPAPIDLA